MLNVVRVYVALCELTATNGRRITLVDLAGSEWAADRAQHSQERQQEGARINSSLMSLKQCLRAKQLGGHAPFRDSKLTHALREALTDPEHCTLLLATIAPGSLSTEHTISTLEHANRRAIREQHGSTSSTASQMVTVAAGMGEGAAGEAVEFKGTCPATWSPAVSAVALLGVLSVWVAANQCLVGPSSE